MRDQPNPTTGEWTPEELVECVNGVGYKELARRINAALAAEKSEREIVERSRDAWKSQVAGLTEALAAEREKYNELYERANRNQDRLREQLAAASLRLVDALTKARETIKAWHGDVAWPEYQQSPEMKIINAALAGAIASPVCPDCRMVYMAGDQHICEQKHALVDALTLVRKTLCSGGGLREATDIIDDALAKVKGK